MSEETRPDSLRELFDDLEDLDAHAWDECGKALAENDRSCARDPGHDGDCAPASALCPGCGQMSDHKMSCSVQRSPWVTRRARKGDLREKY